MDADGGCSNFDKIQAQVLKDILKSGFSLSVKKLQLDPVQQRVFLGFLLQLDKGLLKVSDARVHELRQTLAAILKTRHHVHVKLLAKAAGQLQTMAPAIGPAARIFTRGMYHLIDTKPLYTWNWHVKLDEAATHEIQFWLKKFDDVHGMPIWRGSEVETLFFTDAGAAGLGGFLVKDSQGNESKIPATLEEYGRASNLEIAQGYLSVAEQAESSTWRELIAIERSLKALMPQVAGKHVRLFSDNLAVSFLWQQG